VKTQSLKSVVFFAVTHSPSNKKLQVYNSKNGSFIIVNSFENILSQILFFENRLIPSLILSAQRFESIISKNSITTFLCNVTV
jgi:hypothetical protein